jgi:F-type H+-transporting ATPase subunit gamma
MAQTQALNRRIRSVKNAKQVTKAMEVVAASRMRRVQEAAGKARSYDELARSIIEEVSLSQEAKIHPFFKQDNITSRLYIIFTSDRGMAGAFNSNVFSTAMHSFTEDQKNGISTHVIVIGRKGSRYFSRFSKAELLAAYDGLEDAPAINVFAPIIETINDGFISEQFNAVNIIFTEFVSTLSQVARNVQLLPVPQEVEEEKSNKLSGYELEPNNDIVLKESLKLYIEAQLMRAKVDSSASEYAMRMMAMSNANRNASDLIDHLTLELNATRQAAITQEIAEITGGAAAIE